MHLKVIQQMSKVPRSIGIPPLSDEAFEQAFTSNAAAAAAAAASSARASAEGQLVPMGSVMMQGVPGVPDDDGRINPLAGMGLSDEQYATILQNLVNGESFSNITRGLGDGIAAVNAGEKRGLDDAGDGREGKRSRFELVE
jgi:osomolarity two-component system response regulator SKN7